jgi:hypothetical protein
MLKQHTHRSKEIVILSFGFNEMAVAMHHDNDDD